MERDGRQRSTVVRDRIVGIRDEHRRPYVLTASGERYYFADYHTVFCSIDIDELWGENTLPYTGRMMIPLLIPGLKSAFPEGAESLHYSSCEFQTRVTEMKVITRHDSPDTLILIEVPVLPGRRAVVSAQRHRARAREQPVRRKGLPAAVGTGVRDLPVLRRSRRQDSQPSVRRAPRRVQVLGHAGDRQRRVSEGAGLPAGVMHRILASTTSHKRESLPATLEVFARLGMRRPRPQSSSLRRARRIGRKNRARRRGRTVSVYGSCPAAGATSFTARRSSTTPCGRSIGRSRSPADLAPT